MRFSDIQRRALNSLGALLILTCMSSCYVTRLAVQQNNLINSRRPIDRVVADPTSPKSVVEKLKLTKEILAFAKVHGLNTDGAYTYFIELEGNAVSYIVQAAYPDRLKNITTWFPIVGRVPYLGFFKKSERDAKAEEFRTQGLDVTVGGASAFSSLGWFDDPVYSSMLRRSDSDLGHLLFHELTHRTIWIGNSTEFNENLAEFVGEHLTQIWLQSKNKLEDFRKYEERRQDRELLRTWVEGLKSDLTSLYKSPPIGGIEALLAQKAAIFKTWQTVKKPDFKINDLVGDDPWNNATVLATSMYSPETERFKRAYQCSQLPNESLKIGAFLVKLKMAQKTHRDPFKALDSFCPS